MFVRFAVYVLGACTCSLCMSMFLFIVALLFWLTACWLGYFGRACGGDIETGLGANPQQIYARACSTKGQARTASKLGLVGTHAPYHDPCPSASRKCTRRAKDSSVHWRLLHHLVRMSFVNLPQACPRSGPEGEGRMVEKWVCPDEGRLRGWEELAQMREANPSGVCSQCFN